MRQKVVYILPFYDPETDTHLYYNYGLIEAASKQLDIFVVVEKHSEVKLPNKKWQMQKFQNPILRFLELLFLCLKLHVSGYRSLYSHYSYYGAFAGILTGMKTFYWNRGMPWLFRRGWFEEMIFHIVLRHSILVTSPRELAQEYARRYGVKEYKILSNWIDVDAFSPKNSKEDAKRALDLDPAKKHILFVHHLSERKGVDLIAKTAGKLSGTENIEFLVVGGGPYRKTLEEDAKHAPIPIRMVGEIPNREVVRCFQAADIFFMPSREEGSPHVILEAMAAGTPFVAADVGGIREVIPKEAEEFLCPSGDIGAFAEKIKKLLESPQNYTRAREAGLRHAQNFSKERGVREFISLFE